MDLARGKLPGTFFAMQATGSGPSLHLPQCSIIPALGGIADTAAHCRYPLRPACRGPWLPPGVWSAIERSVEAINRARADAGNMQGKAAGPVTAAPGAFIMEAA